MPEKTKKEVQPQAREYFEKGIIALRKDNLDYATKLFEQALRREPGFFECREALRLNQFKRSAKKSGLFKRRRCATTAAATTAALSVSKLSAQSENEQENESHRGKLVSTHFGTLRRRV